MIDKINEIAFEMPKNAYNAIKVIGVGGGGSNAVDYMYQQEIKGVDFVICNTDAQALENSPIPNKVQLGLHITEGMGAGANPEIGEKAAEESYSELKKLLDTNTKMVFITAGMGGGTGTGAAPVIAKIAKEIGLLTVGIVTMPFEFEGKSRNAQALKGIANLRENVDSLIVINNNKLRDVYGNLGYKSGFAKADEVLSTAARGIAEVITHHYKQNIDLNDAKTVLQNSGTAIMGSANAIGDERARKAIISALDSPLLNDNKIKGAKNVLLLIVSGTKEITLDEIGEINDHIRSEAGHDVNIILGIGDDESIGEAVSVTIIATGFSSGQQDEIAEVEEKTIIHVLDDGQEMQFDLFDAEPVKKQSVNPLDDESTAAKAEKVVHVLKEDTTEKPESYNAMLRNIDITYTDIFPPVKEEIEKAEVIDIIPNQILLRDMEVSFDCITPDDKEVFIIREEKPHEVISQTNVEETTAKQMELTFEFPVEKEERVHEPTNEKEVADSIISPDFSEVKKHVLTDYEEDIPAQSAMANKKPEIEDLELNFELKTVEPIEELKPVEEVATDIRDIEVTEITPLTASIADYKKTAEKRKMHLKKSNYIFRDSSANIDELEKEPAYKRQKTELTENPPSSEEVSSRTTIDFDENDDIQLRSNNSFLHDNVD